MTSLNAHSTLYLALLKAKNKKEVIIVEMKIIHPGLLSNLFFLTLHCTLVWDSTSKLKSLLHSSQRVVKGLCGTWWGQNLVCDAWKQLKETGDAWIYEKKHW